MKTQTIAILAASLGLLSASFAQENEFYSLKGKHHFTFSAGALTESINGDDWGEAAIEYNYWFSENLAVKVATFGMGSGDWEDYEDDDDYDWEYRDTMGAMLVGFEMRPDFLNLSKNVFFTVNAMAGPYIKEMEDREWRYDERRDRWYRTDDDETVFGAYVGGKLNVVVGSRFIVGAAAGYHFIGDFDEPSRGEKDFSSPDFRFTFGFLF